MTAPLPPNAVFTPPIKQPFNPPVGLPGEPVEAPAAAAPVATATREKMAVLRFLDPGAVSKTVPLKFPFAYVGDGMEIEVREITVRRLAVAEVGAIVIGKTADNFDLFAFYAAMTGLPEAVLRAMPADEEVVDICRPFLPRPVKDLLEALSLPFGAASPSPPPNLAESPSDAS